MRSDYVLAGEGLGALSARLGVPACALMRANGLFSPAWLLPGREVLVPEGLCGGGFPCPREAFHRVAVPLVFAGPGDTAASLAARCGLSEAAFRRINGLRGPVLPGMALRRG